MRFAREELWVTFEANCDPEGKAAVFGEGGTEVVPGLSCAMDDEGVPPEPDASPSEVLVFVVLLPPEPLRRRCM